MIPVYPARLISLMSNLLTAEVKEALKPLSPKTLLITAGNDMRSDDGVGPYIYSKLSDIKSLNLLNASFTPENIIEKAIKFSPETLVFIDAADFKGIPGEVRVIPVDAIGYTSISTHTVPLSTIAELIESETSAKTVFIGIQPLSVNFGEGLSDEVKSAADILADFIIKEACCA